MSSSTTSSTATSSTMIVTTLVATVVTASAAFLIWKYNKGTEGRGATGKSSSSSSSPPLKINELIQASLMGDIDQVKALLRDDDDELSVTSTDQGGNTALHGAVCGGKNLELIQFLIAKHDETKSNEDDSNSNSSWKEHKNDIGCTIVWLAAAYGHDEILKFLLNEPHKCNVNTSNNTGDTALLASCQKGNVNCVKLLLEYGANVNQCNNNGTSPLLISVSNNHLHIVKILLQQNKNNDAIDVNLCNNSKISPLLAACASSVMTRGNENDHKELITLLLEAPGCNVHNLQDSNGLNALMVSSFGCNDTALRCIINHSYNNNSTDTNNAEINIIDDVDGIGNGTTALWLAASSGSIKCCKLLLELGHANVHHKNTKGVSVIDATKQGRLRKDKNRMKDMIILLEKYL